MRPIDDLAIRGLKCRSVFDRLNASIAVEVPSKPERPADHNAVLLKPGECPRPNEQANRRSGEPQAAEQQEDTLSVEAGAFMAESFVPRVAIPEQEPIKPLRGERGREDPEVHCGNQPDGRNRPNEEERTGRVVPEQPRDALQSKVPGDPQQRSQRKQRNESRDFPSAIDAPLLICQRLPSVIVDATREEPPKKSKRACNGFHRPFRFFSLAPLRCPANSIYTFH